jgi:hypothetical protein
MPKPLLWRFTAWFLLAAGATLFLSYPLHELAGLTFSATTPRLVYYNLATFGAAATAWGLILLRAAGDPNLQDAIAMPTAIGFALLAAMRVLALIGGSEVLVDLIPVRALRMPVTATEILFFGFLAYRFWAGTARRG